MRIARYTTGDDPAYGVVEGDPGSEVIAALTGDPLYIGLVAHRRPRARWRTCGCSRRSSRAARWSAIGRTTPTTPQEMGGEVPAEPLMFLMPNTSVVGPGDPVVLPPPAARSCLRGRARRRHRPIAKDVQRRERAPTCIYGYTVANDVTARDLQRSDGQWARAKGFDTLLPARPVDRDRPRPRATSRSSRPASTARWSQDGRPPT